MNPYLSISPEVQQALDEGRPVVALESTIISHGMPYPQNVETALKVEQTIRDGGAVPPSPSSAANSKQAARPTKSSTWAAKARP